MNSQIDSRAVKAIIDHNREAELLTVHDSFVVTNNHAGYLSWISGMSYEDCEILLAATNRRAGK